MISENIPRLSGDRIVLTLFRTDEVAANLYAKWMSDETTCALIEHNNTVVDESYMAGWLTDNKPLRFGICEKETMKLIGYCHIDHRSLQDASWLSINIGEESARGKGYGKEVINLLLKYSFQELGVQSVHLDVLSTNIAGIKCYEKCGFQVSGRYRCHHIHDGQHLDWLHMDILLKEWESLHEQYG